MTDLHTHLLYDPCNQIATDGRLVQTFVDGRARVNVTGILSGSRWLAPDQHAPRVRARRIAARASGA
jgi:hypothetical protein